LPQDADMQTSARSEPRLPQTAAPPRVLVVDDDPIAREMASETLISAGYACATAEDGDVALVALGAQPADLVILDMIMPNKEGIETLGEIKRRWPATRVIMVSGGTRAMQPQTLLGMASSLGADATMLKPLWGERLLDLVRRVLAAPAAAQ
jgi:DNA-binding response OmpR family regulator